MKSNEKQQDLIWFVSMVDYIEILEWENPEDANTTNILTLTSPNGKVTNYVKSHDIPNRFVKEDNGDKVENNSLREDGFYWVFYSTEWTISEWNKRSNGWVSTLGLIDGPQLQDTDFSKIDERKIVREIP